MRTVPPPVQEPLAETPSVNPLVALAARGWRERLIDAGHRNNLLFYRELRRGTLDLGSAGPQAMRALLGSRPVRLSSLYRDDDQRADAVRRAMAIYRKGREHFEERGLKTVHVGFGAATWTNPNGGAAPNAPVLLRPVELRPVSTAATDFEIVPDGDVLPNETLIQYLESQFQLSIDREALDAHVDGEIDTPGELGAALGWIASQARGVPGFAVTEALVLSTFTYAKLPMVKDLEDEAALSAHDLVAALAGDGEARERVRERQGIGEPDPDLPDRIDPSEEHLVLDADASQHQAINSVLAGRDLVIKGPPGTGKSQTIANLIAALVARGQTVLFVAEKRAAIEAVTRRLEQVGLADIVFDLHGQASRRDIAQRLRQALDGIRATIAVDRQRQDRALRDVRDQLNAHVEALHAVREPWGVSVYDLQADLLGLPAAADVGVRLGGDALNRLGAAAIEAAEHDLRRYVTLGGPQLLSDASPWARAQIATPDDAGRVVELLDRIALQLLPAARGPSRPRSPPWGSRRPPDPSPPRRAWG